MALPVNSANGPFPVPPEWCGIIPGCSRVGQGQALTQPFYQAFLKGEPKALGTVQISLVIIHLALAAVLIATINGFMSMTIYSGVTFWGAIFYLISGSLAIAAVNKESRCKVRGTLSISIISCIAAFLEIILIIMDFILYYNYYENCNGDYQCRFFLYTIRDIRMISLGFLLFVSLLQFSVSLSLSIFGCKSLSHESIQQPQQVYVINNNYSIVMTSGQFLPGNENTNFIPETFSGIVSVNNPDKKNLKMEDMQIGSKML